MARISDKQRKAMFAKKGKSIRVGDNPEGDPKINKFIDSKTNEGLRGKLIALKDNKKQAIVLAMNSSFGKGGVKWGELHLVEEKDPDQFPFTKKKVNSIPNTKDWNIV